MKYAIISDVHEDIQNLEKVITKIQKYDVDKLVCLGDITGFSNLHHSHIKTKDADTCIDLLKKNCDIFIAGNHDFNTIGKLPAYLKRHTKAKSYLRKETWKYADEVNSELNEENIMFLGNCPEYVIEDTGNFNLFSHFIFPDLTGSTIMVPQTKKELKSHFNFMTRRNCLLSFVGHTHINGFALTGSRHVHFKKLGYKKLTPRTRVIFCPATVKDGRRSGFMIFDSKTFELSIEKINV